MQRAHLLVAGFVIAFAPRPAHGQVEAFVQAARVVAVSSAQPEPARTDGVRAGVAQLAAALREWDRNVAALETRVGHEMTGADSARQFQLHVELALTYRARGRLADALREFDAAAAAQPGSSDLEVLRALTLEASGRLDESARAFRSAWTSDSQNPVKAYYALLRDGLSSTDRDLARETLTDSYRHLSSATPMPASAPFPTLDVIPDMLTRMPVVGDERTARGFSLIAAGQFSAAVDALTGVARAPGQPGSDPLSRFATAQAHEAAGEIAEARRDYSASLAGALSGRSLIYVAIGRLAQVDGDVAAAAEALAHAVRLSPQDPTMRRELAGSYVAMGRADDALTELIAGVLVDPSHAALHAAIGQLHLDAGRPAQAIPAFTRALELNPAGYEVRYALATALTRLGRISEAAPQLAMFERARREQLDRRRQGIQQEIAKEEMIRRTMTNGAR